MSTNPADVVAGKFWTGDHRMLSVTEGRERRTSGSRAQCNDIIVFVIFANKFGKYREVFICLNV